MNTVILLKLASSLNTLPGRRDLDEDTIPLDTDRFVKGNKFLGLRAAASVVARDGVFRKTISP